MTDTDGPDRVVPSRTAEELGRTERAVMTELDPGARAMVVAGLVLVATGFLKILFPRALPVLCWWSRAICMSLDRLGKEKLMKFVFGILRELKLKSKHL